MRLPYPDAMALLSTLHFGMVSQQLANDPTGDWDHGHFTRLFPQMIEIFIRTYPPIDSVPTG